MIVDMRHLLAILPAVLAISNMASAQTPPCLQFQAPDTISCGPLHRSEPLTTPQPLYAPWKAIALSRQMSMRYLTYSDVGPTGEPLFKQSGLGVARTADEWLALGPGVFFFDSVDGGDPQEANGRTNLARLTPPITISGRTARDRAFLVQGFAYFNTRELRVEGRRDVGVPTPVRQPSEPFFDLGIDLDHDGIICAERGKDACCPDSADGPEAVTRCNEFFTVTNSRWDVELDEACDPRIVACASDGPTADAPWPAQRPEWDAFIRMHAEDGDASVDPRMLGVLAHEPFLEWGDSATPDDVPPIRWSFARESRGTRTARATQSLSSALLTPGYDRGEAEILTRLSLQGVLYNEGRIVLGDGFAGSGAVLAGGGVMLARGAQLTWSSDFARGKFPPPEWVGVPDYCNELITRASSVGSPVRGISR